MKITSFHPLIVSPKGEEVVKLFEELGFAVKHRVEVIPGTNVTNVTMESADGRHVDVATAPNQPRDLTLIRMNVDDFDEAYALLTARGFKNTRGDQTVDTQGAKSAMMVSPSGFAFDLCQHLK